MNNTQSYPVFLLGGYDLEMLTIKQLLDERDDCVVIDKHLKWDNAFFSAYQDELSLYAHHPIYGVELVADIPLPDNCYIIDHHNQEENNDSALEQVAMILGVTLNRYQLLVAANDKGYIPAMMAMSVTKEEIQKIREMDRSAQGISHEDELLAEQSIFSNLSRHGVLTVVHSLTPHFSCICDRLFPYQSLLVYNEDVWTFYGEGKAELVNLLKEDVAQQKLYFGGGEDGFVGSVKGAYTKEEIFNFVQQIISKYEQI